MQAMDIAHAGGGKSRAANNAAASDAALRGAALAPPPTSERRCRVVVSSAGAWAELAAVERIFRQCSVESIRVSSGVREQPVGHEEALQGAVNRLEGAKAARPGADFYVSVERSLTEVSLPACTTGSSASGSSASGSSAASPAEPRYFEVSWVLLERVAGSALRAVVPSCGVEIPVVDVEQARAKSFVRKTAGAITADRVGLLDGKEPHSWLTAGRRSREALLGEAISVALGQLERAGRGQPAQKLPVEPPTTPSTSGRRKWLPGGSSE